MNYVAFLRGINVGGKNIVKMKDLKQMFTDLGMKNVRTYVQSGNVVFDSDFSKEVIKEMISKRFTEYYNFTCILMIRSVEEMEDLYKTLPFTKQEIETAETADPTVEHLYVYFTDDSYEQGRLEELNQRYDGADRIRVGNQAFYLLCYDSVRLSKLAIRITKEYDTTARNWKTIENIIGMLRE